MKHRALFSCALAACIATSVATSGPAATRTAGAAVTVHVAAAIALPPCMPQFANANSPEHGFFIDPPIQPGRVSWMRFVVGDLPVQADQLDLAVSRPDGSKRHLVRFTRSGDVFTSLSGSDPRPYGIGDAGTWILYDHAGQPWMRYVAQLESWFSTVSVPERIVTAGETVTVGTRLVGWNTGSVLGPVAGMSMTTFVVAPNHTSQTVQGTTSTDGRYNLTFTATSNRRFSISANFIPDQPVRRCATHAGAGANVGLIVRKRITRTVSDSTPAVGQAVRIAGTVYPGAAGLRTYLQRWNGSSFVTIANTQLGSTGDYAFSYRPTTRGTHTLRVFTSYDAWNVSSASPNVYLQVS